MSSATVIHEGFMNGSRTIQPRVGGGVGVGGGGRNVVLHSSYLTTANGGLWITRRPAVPHPPMQRSDDGGVR